jgi:uncharacterized protein
VPIVAKPNIVIEHDVVIPLRDGTRTVADVYRADDGNRYPVILTRAIYGKNRAGESAPHPGAISFVRAGYVFVSQDCRGCGGSEGDWEFFFQEQNDGYDTVEWLADQPWSTGKVGIIGASGHGMTAYQAVAAQPPSLAAAYILVGRADMQSWAKRAGALSELHMGGAYLAGPIGMNNIARLDVDDSERGELLQSLLAALGATREDLMRLPVLDARALTDDRLTAGCRNILLAEPTDPFWQKDATSLGNDPGRARAPVKAVAAMYDPFLPSMINVFSGGADLGHELIIGPWGHFGAYGQPSGLKDFKDAPGGSQVWTPSMHEWFNRWMKDDPSPEPASSTVYYFLAGENRWAASPTWPPAGQALELFLTSVGDSAAQHGGGAVVFEQPAAAGSRNYRYDPADPVPTIGGVMVEFGAATRFDRTLTADAAHDQRCLESRSDVLVYTSAELTDIVRLAGPVSAHLWVASSAEDTDFFVRVIDVEPDGFAGNVTEGLVRARYRHGGNDAWLTPGERVEMVMELDPTAHSFLPGHRIRVHITSSSFPKFSRNLNTRAVPEFGTSADIAVAEQTIFDGADTPSRIAFHVVPATKAASPYTAASHGLA